MSGFPAHVFPSLLLRRRRYGGLAVRVHSHAGGKEITQKTVQGFEVLRREVSEGLEERSDLLKKFEVHHFQSPEYKKVNDVDMGEEIIVDQDKLEVTYIGEDGKKITKKGGHKAWRTNNPGNLNFSSWEKAKESGAIGIWDDGRHKYAIYESEAKGMQALSNLLNEKRFSRYSDGSRRPIANMIGELYAPASDNNNPRAYVDFIARHGIDPSKTVEELSEEEKQQLMNAIYTMEGRKQGQTIEG